jgi:hypothetical protein
MDKADNVEINKIKRVIMQKKNKIYPKPNKLKKGKKFLQNNLD